jgi:hypothetical protein
MHVCQALVGLDQGHHVGESDCGGASEAEHIQHQPPPSISGQYRSFFQDVGFGICQFIKSLFNVARWRLWARRMTSRDLL